MPGYPKDHPRPWRDKEWLREHYHDKQFTQQEMAEKAGCGRDTIKRWMDKHDVKRRTLSERAKLAGCEENIRPYMGDNGLDNRTIDDERVYDADWLREQHHENGVRIIQMAEMLDCSRHAVKYWMDKFDIERVEWEQPSGENSRTWEGGYADYYGPNWKEQRRKARDRDDHTCQSCGMTKEEMGREPDVHHIRPFRKFESHERANRLENLVCLCRECHAVWEGIPLRPHSD